MAEQDGKIVDVDDTAHMLTIEYEDGTKDVFKYGDDFVPFAGFYTCHNLKLNVSKNQKVKKGDILTYNTGFFKKDPSTGQLDMTIGTLANVALMETDTTLEDSTEISPRLSEKLTIHPVNIRTITLKKNSVIYDYKKIGDEVNITDDLLVFDEELIEGSDIFKVDEETMKMMAELNRKTPNAKYKGIISKINAYSGCPIAEMHPSLQKVFRESVAWKNKEAKYAEGTAAENDYSGFVPMKEGSKYLGVTFDKDTVLLIYYIKESITNDKGDKLVFGNQLKCTTAGVFEQPVTSESGVYIDSLFSCCAIERRIVTSAIKYGIMSRLMERIEDNAVDMYFK